MKNVYILAHDECMHNGHGGMSEFVGTYRELLEKLNRVTDVNRDDVMGDGRTIGDLTNSELEALFQEANGEPYYMVWDVAAKKQVLG